MTSRLVMSLALVAPSVASATVLSLTGDVDADFASASRVEVVTDGALPDLNPGSPAANGLDVRSVTFHYDEPSDTLYVGFKTWVSPGGDAVIFGDVDGDGDPGGITSPIITGVDQPNLAGGETVTLVLDVDQDGTADFVAGVPTTAGIFAASVSTISSPLVLSLNPGAAYDQPVPGATLSTGPSPSASAPHFEMAIEGLDLAGSGGVFGVWAFVASTDAPSFGQDFVPDAGNFEIICFEADGDGDGIPECAGDCDDTNADIYPDAPELCDGLDNNCSGSLPAEEIGYPNGAQCFDNDGDGLTNGEEADLGTDPDALDSDGDGLEDGAEVLIHGTDPASFDSDGGGSSDGLEISEGSDPTYPGDDDGDRDGLDNDAEALAGTNPNQADTDNDGLDDGVEINDTLTSPTQSDSDNDGLSDGDELDEGTNPLLADTDGGGALDGLEIDFGTDPLDASDDDQALDNDGDGLSNVSEIDVYGTDPEEADTDGDGLSDGDEVLIHETDPTLFDTDGDGLDDQIEILTHDTDPTLADTDGGGVSDGAELSNGTDPLDATDDTTRPGDDVDVEYWGGGHAKACNSTGGRAGWLALLLLPLLRRRD